MILAKVLDVARGIKKKKLAYVTLGVINTHGFSKKNVCQFGPAVWPAIANIFMSEKLYFIDS